MTLQEQLRDAETELARLGEHSAYLKTFARIVREYNAAIPPQDPPLILAMAEYLAKTGDFQAVALDRTIAQIREQIKAATSSVIIPTVGGMQ